MLFLAAGCNSWLDLLPANDQTTDQFWQSKEEVESVLYGTYTQMRNCIRQFVPWGELRGDGITLGPALNAEEDAIKRLDILPSNSICKWEALYTTIGRANSVIKYGPDVLDRDPTFKTEYLNSLIAEAIYLRSLCYFYLVRTFGSVPYITEPYVDDSQDYSIPVSSESHILGELTKTLEAYKGKCKLGYEAIGSDTWQNTGRATQWAYHALLADIYLWQGNYGAAVKACDDILTKYRFTLVNTEDWYTVYNPGNSAESIFELNWSSMYNQVNELYLWFYNGTANQRYAVSNSTVELFKENTTIEDIRGNFGSYLESNGKIWKYAGYSCYNKSTTIRMEDANWIFYRLPDIYLIKAEALIMLDQQNYQAACDLIDMIRERAGYKTKVAIPASEYDALILVMQERQREFFAEGKRWFDILRIAKRNNYKYKNYLVDILLKDIPAKDRARWEAKLSDVNSYYLPIFKTEIENSRGVLVQNPYYADLD